MRQPGPVRIHAVDYRAAQDAADVRAMLDLSETSPYPTTIA